MSSPNPNAASAESDVLSAPLRPLVGLVLTLAAVLLIREVASLVAPLLFGAFLALVAWPLVGALERRGFRHSIAIASTVLAVFVVLIAGALVLALSVGQLLVLVPTYEDRLAALIESVQAELARVGVDADPGAVLAIFSPAQIVAILRPVASAVSGMGLATLVLFLTMTYALVGGGSMRRRAEAALGREHALLLGLERFGSDLRRYLLVRAALGLFAGMAVFVLLLLTSVPLPGLWAFGAFAASFIPNIGIILALVPPALLALLGGGVEAVVTVIVGYVAINLVQDNVLQPVVLGTELNLSPLAVFVAVVAWAWILGAPGAFLAVPLTLGLLAILEGFPASRGLAALLRNRVDEPPGLISEPAMRR